MKRSVVAVGAGVVFIIVVTTVIDIVLHVAGVYPPWGEPLDHVGSAIALSYRLAIGLAGSWLTARLAPDHAFRHVMILGSIGFVLSTIGVIATWNLNLGPRWYPVSLAVTALPMSWLAGWWFDSATRE